MGLYGYNILARVWRLSRRCLGVQLGASLAVLFFSCLLLMLSGKASWTRRSPEALIRRAESKAKLDVAKSCGAAALWQDHWQQGKKWQDHHQWLDHVESSSAFWHTQQHFRCICVTVVSSPLLQAIFTALAKLCLSAVLSLYPASGVLAELLVILK